MPYLTNIKLLPVVSATSQVAIERGLTGSNADKWARVLVRMALLRDLSWGKTPKGGKLAWHVYVAS